MKRTFFFIFFIFLFGCEKEDEPAFPLVQTGAVTNITPEGAVFNAKILQQGEHEIVEYGFIWGAEGTTILTDGQKVSISEIGPDNTFSFVVSTTLSPDVKYQVKAFVRDKEHTTYGATVRFVSLGSGAPQLTNFYPKAGNLWDTVTIIGNNFSHIKNDNRVLFDDKVSQVLYASRDTLQVQVPQFLQKEFSKLSVAVVNNAASFKENFELYAPVITDIYPQQVDLKDTLTIIGRNLYSTPLSEYFPLPKVKFGTRGVSGVIPVSSDTLLVIVSPFVLEESFELHLTNYNGVTTTWEKPLNVKRPEISGFYPEIGDLNDTLTIVGKNLSSSPKPGAYPLEVKFGSTGAKLLYASPDTLMVRVPQELYKKTSILSVRNHNKYTATAEKQFKLHAPQINSFYPEKANLKDTLTIIGKHFTTRSLPARTTEVRIGGWGANIVRLSPDTVVVTVPERPDKEIAGLELRNHNGLIHTAEKQFQLYSPKITDFSPKEGGFDAIITITGDFAANPVSLEAFIGSQKATIQESSNTWLKVVLPFDLMERTNAVSVKMNNVTKVASEKFTVAPLILYDFSPKITETGQEIIITGENFHPQAEKNLVSIGGLPALVLSNSTTNELHVRVPLQDMEYYTSRNASVSVEVLSDKKTFDEELFINDTWFRITDYPGASYNDAYYDYSSFVINNTAYIGLKSSSQFWSLNLETKEWKSLASYPGYSTSGTGFVANDKVYFGTATEWHEFNPVTNTWTGKKNISDENASLTHGFSFQNKGYAVLKKASEPFPKIWTYNDVQNSWAETIDFPEVQGGSYYTEFAIANDSEIFLGLREGNDARRSKMMIYVYSFATASWRKIADYPADGGGTPPLKFILNNQLFLKTHYAWYFWKYEEGTDTWTQEPTGKLGSFRWGGISFSNNGKAYAGLGRESAIWEYDPNR
jgi:hypothetical protein